MALTTKTILPCLALCAVLSSSHAAEVPALKDAFQHKFLIGAALNPKQFNGQDAVGAALVIKHFNAITPENVLKWQEIHPRENKFKFNDGDQYVRFGEEHNLTIIGHNLIWPRQTPAWVFRRDGKPVDRETLQKRLRKHIDTVVERYKDRIKGWDVVNEALDENGKLRESEWYKIMGFDYILKAFEFTHRADPNAELYYNDYGLENAPKRHGAIKLIKDLKARGVSVTAVGLQGHYKMDWPEPKDLAAAIDDFAAIGVKCMITEMDIDVLPSTPGDSPDIDSRSDKNEKLNPYATGLPKDMQEALAHRYAELFKVLVKSGHVTRVTFWGVTDADSWLNNWPVRGRTNYPLLFNRKGEPKEAFYEVLETATKSARVSKRQGE